MLRIDKGGLRSGKNKRMDILSKYSQSLTESEEYQSETYQ